MEQSQSFSIVLLRNIRDEEVTFSQKTDRILHLA